MNVEISSEMHKGDNYIRFKVNAHDIVGHDSHILFTAGICLIETHKVIFDFSLVHNANSSFLDALVKITKRDKKGHALFIFSSHLFKIVSSCGLHKVIKIIN